MNQQQQPPNQPPLPAHPIPKPNNNRQAPALAYQIDQGDTASINAIQCNEIEVRSGKKLSDPAPLAIIEVDMDNSDESPGEQEKDSQETPTETIPLANNKELQIEVIPYPKRLIKKAQETKSELLQEIRKLNIFILVLQAVKQVPELNKLVKELCIQKGGRRKKVYPKTIKVDGKVADLLAGNLVISKYGDPSNLVITIFIGVTRVFNVLVDLGATINIMTMDMSQKLFLSNIHPTSTVLQMVD